MCRSTVVQRNAAAFPCPDSDIQSVKVASHSVSSCVVTALLSMCRTEGAAGMTKVY